MVEVILDAGERNRRALRERLCYCKGSVAKFRVWHHAVDETQRLASPGVDPFREKHQLPRARCSDKSRQQPCDSVIPRQPDARIPGGHDCGFGGNAHIAGERKRKPGTRRGPRERGKRRLSHSYQRTGQRALLGPKVRNSFLKRHFCLI